MDNTDPHLRIGFEKIYNTSYPAYFHPTSNPNDLATEPVYTVRYYQLIPLHGRDSGWENNKRGHLRRRQ